MMPPPFLPPRTAARSPRAAARPIWPRTLAPSVPEGPMWVPGPNCTKIQPKLHRSVDTLTSPPHSPTRCTARAPCTSRASYARLLGVGRGSTAPPSAVKLSRTFCVNASNVAPLKTNCCWKAFAPSICWRFPANFGKNTHSLTKHKTHSPS